jgi:integrase
MKTKRTPAENQLRVYLKWCVNVKQLTPSTMATKRSVLGRFIVQTKTENMSQLTNKKLNWWIEKKALGYFGARCNPTTIRTSVATIVAWIVWLRDMNYPMKIKTRMVVKPKPAPCRRKWYTSEQIAMVLNECDDLLTEVMIRVLFDTGMRAQEFSNLRLSDLNGRTIYTVGKGRKDGWVYISDTTRERLDAWIRAAGVIDYMWIKTTRHNYFEPLTVDGIRKKIQRQFREAGLENFQLHELRHSFATDVRKRGADVDVVRRLLRHSSLQVTQRYLHNLDGDMCEIWDEIKNYKLAANAHAGTAYIGGEIVDI